MAAYNACIDAKRTAVIAALAEATAQQGKDGGGVLRTLAFSPPVPAMPTECRGRRALDSSATSAEIAQFNACAAARSAQKASTQARGSSFDYSVETPTVDAKAGEAKAGDKPSGKPDLAPEQKQDAAEPASDVPEAKPGANMMPADKKSSSRATAGPSEDEPRQQALGMTVPASVATRRSDQ
jgi:hypothetical protein